MPSKLPQLNPVEIDSNGVYKYVLIEAYEEDDKGVEQRKLLVIFNYLITVIFIT